MTGGAPGPEDPWIRLNQDRADPRTFGTVELGGLAGSELASLAELSPADWPERFPVAVLPEPGRAPGDVAPMLGTYRVEGRLVRFAPRYPLLEGQRYVGRYAGREAVLALDRPDRPRPRVLRVYPSSELVPENLLRFHVCFSAPMRDGEALPHVRLFDGEGNVVPDVFLDPLEELWDGAGTCLTLLLDPGRVKTGLVAHEQRGRALRAGERYRLQVDGAFRDVHGQPLEAEITKALRAGPAAGGALDIARFRLCVPAAGTRAPLTLHFPAAMDAVQALLFVRLRGPPGHFPDGDASLEEAETAWRFVPREPWKPGKYGVAVDSRLEDLAGNNLQGPFDAPPGPRRSQERHALPFVIP